MVPVLGIDPGGSDTMRFLYNLPGSCAVFKVSKEVQVDVNDVIETAVISFSSLIALTRTKLIRSLPP
jgi:hypothetical protein